MPKPERPFELRELPYTVRPSGVRRYIEHAFIKNDPKLVKALLGTGWEIVATDETARYSFLRRVVIESAEIKETTCTA